MKKRNCRMTEKERVIHEKAVKIKKMTDAQVCDFIDRTYARGLEDGKKTIQTTVTIPHPEDGAAHAKRFIEYLQGRTGSGNRIGLGTILQLNRELDNAIKGGLFNKEVAT